MLPWHTFGWKDHYEHKIYLQHHFIPVWIKKCIHVDYTVHLDGDWLLKHSVLDHWSFRSKKIKQIWYLHFTITLSKSHRWHEDEHLKAYLLRQKDGLYMLVLLASPRWRWCPGQYSLVPYGFRFCMQPSKMRQDTSSIREKLIKPTYRAHLFYEVSTPLIQQMNFVFTIRVFNKIVRKYRNLTTVHWYHKLNAFAKASLSQM